jgi:hypothetical protein
LSGKRNRFMERRRVEWQEDEMHGKWEELRGKRITCVGRVRV